MPYKLIDITKITVEPGYNIVRTDKEVHANAIEVAEFMEASGDSPELYPIKYVKGPNGELFTRNHATLKAAEMRGWKQIVAVESPHKHGSTEDYLDLLFSNNAGHPINRVSQGRLYKQLRDGIKAEDWTEESPNWIKEPMTEKEIGEAGKPTDYSAEHVRQCIVLADSSPDVQLLLESDKVGANIVITALQWAKGDEAKQLKILRAAVRQAESEGVSKATKRHLDAIKSDFVQLKAAGPTGDSEKPKGGSKPGGSNDAPTDLSLEGETQPPAETPNLFAQTGDDVPTTKSSAKDEKKIIAALVALFVNDETLGKIGVTMTLADDEAEALATEVVKTYQAATSIL